MSDGIIGTFQGVNFEAVEPSKDAVIVHTFSTENNFCTVMKIHSELIRAFPDNKVIAVPDESSVHLLDKQSAIEMLYALIHFVQGDQ